MNDNYVWEIQTKPGGALTWKGRIGRKYYLLYGLPLYFISFLAGKAHLIDITGALVFAMMVLKVGASVLLVFNMIKRLHDLLLPGWLAVVMVLTIFISEVFEPELVALTQSEGAGRYLSDVIVLLSFFTICMQVYMLLKKGTNGPNKYGEDPLKKEIAEEV